LNKEKKMKKHLYLTLVIVVLLSVSSFAQKCLSHSAMPEKQQFQRGQFHQRMRKSQHKVNFQNPKMILKFKEEINLSDEQIKKIEQADFSHRKSMIELKKDLELEELNLEKIMNESFDKEKILSQYSKTEAIKTQLQKNRFEHQVSVQAMLTEEQRNQLRELKRARPRHKNKP